MLKGRKNQVNKPPSKNIQLKQGMHRHCGGTGHKNFNYMLKLELTKYKTWEGQCIEVMRGKTLSKPLYIGNIYRPPKEKL